MRRVSLLLLILTLTAQFARANNLLVCTLSGVYSFDGNSGAYKGTVGGTIETSDGFCFGADGALYITGNDLGNGHLEKQGQPAANTPSAIYQVPHGIGLGPDGNIYGTSNYGSGRGLTGIVRFSGLTPTTFISSGLTSPWALCFGPDGNLYVTQGTNNVLRFNGTTGAFMDTFASGGGLSGAYGLTFGPNNDLFVGSKDTNSILRYDGTTGAYEGAFVTAGSGGLAAPLALAFGGDGMLYVSDSGTGDGKIRRYDAITGAPIDTFINSIGGNHGNFIMFDAPEPSVSILALVGLTLHRRTRTA